MEAVFWNHHDFICLVLLAGGRRRKQWVVVTKLWIGLAHSLKSCFRHFNHNSVIVTVTPTSDARACLKPGVPLIKSTYQMCNIACHLWMTVRRLDRNDTQVPRCMAQSQAELRKSRTSKAHNQAAATPESATLLNQQLLHSNSFESATSVSCLLESPAPE